MTEEAAAPAPAEQSPIAEQPQAEAPQEAGNNPGTAEPTEPKEQPRRSRREALEQAFKTLDDDAGKAGQDAGVKAQNGAASQAPVAPKPAPTVKDEGQPRGPDGKFAPKQDDSTQEAAKEAPEQVEAKAGHDEPPARFSADAKSAWKDAPEPIRAEAHRAIREMEQGIETYRQQVEPLRPFFDLADQQGVRLEDAMSRYVNMENMLRQDPINAFATIAQNMGYSPQQVARAMLGEDPGQADPRDQQIMALQNEIAQLRQGFDGVTQTVNEQQERAVMTQIEKFAADNPRFEELSDEIVHMLQTGYASDLQDAYDKADRMNPAPATEPQPAPPAQPAQTRPARSVTGAPTSGSNPVNRQPSSNRKQALERAFQNAGLA